VLELPASRANVGVLLQKAGDKISRCILDYHHDLQQRGQIGGATFS
jgi:hypothetical protein